MDNKITLEAISEFAISGNNTEVRKCLSAGTNYRTAILYVETFHKNHAASLLIQKEGLCKCGSVAIKWNPIPICGGCNFKNAMKNIEYGPSV